MRRPRTLAAFSPQEYIAAHRLLATKVAMMMGRKFEEDDWAQVYCAAKNIPHRGWSNLNIDIMYQGLGVEHKMLKARSDRSLRTLCGTRIMHPAATRSIRVPSTDLDPQEVMQDILTQYATLIDQRKNKLREDYPQHEPDMRIGWLLWQESLEEFLYFEEEMLVPDPDDYRAEWHEIRSRGARKQSKNLWIFEKETGYKKYSVTTEAGAKIQPYFEVPPPNDPHLYFFRVQGEPIDNGFVRLWVTAATYRELERLIGEISTDKVSSLIAGASWKESIATQDQIPSYELATPIVITVDAYAGLKRAFKGVSDEHIMQLFIRYWREQRMQ